VGADSLFGGVATALILATLWAADQGRGLRIITRTSAPDATGFANLQSLYGLTLPGNPEFVQHAPGASDSLDVRPDDVFLTTSWWTTAATLPSVTPERVCYLLQEDERMFYAAGDEWVRAGTIMSDPRLLVLVNSRGLFDHLVATGCPNIVERGMSFEASFELFTRRAHRPNPPEARQLFFYSRPNNLRNLFYLGVDVLDEALATGVLDPEAWTINLVGPGTPEIEFSGKPRVVYHPKLDWERYASLISGMDLGLSLMATPHTSYPPLDLAAAGAVVVTNSWPGKVDLSQYGASIVLGAPNRRDLVAALARGVELADSGTSPARSEALTRTWPEALGGVLARLSEEYPSV
jgi:hypothetical protein